MQLLGACEGKGEGSSDSDSGTSTGEMPECAGDACAALEADFVDRLTQLGGCGDVHLGAFDPTGTIALELRIDGLVAEAREAGMELKTEFTLPDAAVKLVVQTGTHLDAEFCTDFVEFEPKVDLVYTAISGTVTMSVLAYEGEGGRAAAIFDNVVFAVAGDESVAPVTLASFGIDSEVDYSIP